jgi:hypothetical protein
MTQEKLPPSGGGKTLTRSEDKRTKVTTRKSPIDLRPFKSKADHEREQALEAQYRSLGNAELLAVLDLLKPRERAEREART